MKIQTQEMDQWCWAAVSVSVDKFFNPASSATQCKVAQDVLSRSCCGGEVACNQAAELQTALDKVNRLRKIVTRRLRFKEIENELDAFKPVCARIGWDGGGGHFVVVDKCMELNSGELLVHVLDPLFPNSTIYYDELVSEYLGDGQWTDTFLVK